MAFEAEAIAARGASCSESHAQPTRTARTAMRTPSVTDDVATRAFVAVAAGFSLFFLPMARAVFEVERLDKGYSANQSRNQVEIKMVLPPSSS